MRHGGWVQEQVTIHSGNSGPMVAETMKTPFNCRASLKEGSKRTQRGLKEGLGIGPGKREWDSPSARRLDFDIQRL